MRRLLVALALASSLSGCSLAAAAMGANRRTVRDLAELDRQVIAPIVESAVSSLLSGGAAVGDGAYAPDAYDYMCWLDEDGGEEVRAETSEGARAICVEAHGAYGTAHHCECEPVLGMHASR